MVRAGRCHVQVSQNEESMQAKRIIALALPKALHCHLVEEPRPWECIVILSKGQIMYLRVKLAWYEGKCRRRNSIPMGSNPEAKSKTSVGSYLFFSKSPSASKLITSLPLKKARPMFSGFTRLLVYPPLPALTCYPPPSAMHGDGGGQRIFSLRPNPISWPKK